MTSSRLIILVVRVYEGMILYPCVNWVRGRMCAKRIFDAAIPYNSCRLTHATLKRAYAWGYTRQINLTIYYISWHFVVEA
jgi:hypothetical protein